MLGPHGAFILSAYAATLVIVGGLIVASILDQRAQRRALAAFEARGVRRGGDEA